MNFLRPVTLGSGTLVATGRVVKSGPADEPRPTAEIDRRRRAAGRDGQQQLPDHRARLSAGRPPRAGAWRLAVAAEQAAEAAPRAARRRGVLSRAPARVGCLLRGWLVRGCLLRGRGVRRDDTVERQFRAVRAVRVRLGRVVACAAPGARWRRRPG